MSRGTSIDELYSMFVALTKGVTRRGCWRRNAIQSRPNIPYSTLYFRDAGGVENDVVEIIDDIQSPQEYYNNEPFQQKPWGTSLIQCSAQFIRSQADDSAMDAATRFANSLKLEERFWDIWTISSLLGAIRIVDLSDIFRADVEPRAEVLFTIGANISEPAPFKDEFVWDIDTQRVNIIHVRQNGLETEIQVDIENTVEES